MTRVLVGILYCGENEFDECINSIQRQELVGVDYFVVENLPNKEAHNVLYENFMRNASNFDYFIKVDADMVLCKNTFFADVISEMNEDLSFDNYQIAVLDHYTNSLIYGLHIYRNTVTWNISNSTETIFVDRIENIKKRKNDKIKFAPAAHHAPSPSNFHAYHFGIHKSVKFLQPNTEIFDINSSIYHYSNIIKTYNNWRKTKRVSLGYSIQGFNDALFLNLTNVNVDYNDTFTLERYNNYKFHSSHIKRNYLLKNFGFLPKLTRYHILIYKQSKRTTFIQMLKNILLCKHHKILKGYL